MMRKNAVVWCLALMVFFVGSLSLLNSRVTLNRTDEAFDETDTETSTTTATRVSGLRVLVINGAGAFLDSQGAYLSFLRKYEMSEIQYIETSEMTAEIDRAITALSEAEGFYRELKETADRTPYRYDMHWKLIFFDYNGFQYYNNLNRDVFSRVSYYLSRGDVRGCYGHSLTACRQLLESLGNLKKYIENNDPAALDLAWKLNQTYAESLMFGQYAAQVFYRVTGRW